MQPLLGRDHYTVNFSMAFTHSPARISLKCGKCRWLWLLKQLMHHCGGTKVAYRSSAQPLALSTRRVSNHMYIICPATMLNLWHGANEHNAPRVATTSCQTRMAGPCPSICRSPISEILRQFDEGRAGRTNCGSGKLQHETQAEHVGFANMRQKLKSALKSVIHA